MESCDGVAAGVVLAAFDEYLGRVRGASAGTRRNYVAHARAFLNVQFGDRPVNAAEIVTADVRAYVRELTNRYQPKTVEGMASSLRVLFRYLRVCGLRTDRLDEAVPMVPSQAGSSLVRHLAPGQLTLLLASLDSSTPRGLRDRGIILCMARLGLRGR